MKRSATNRVAAYISSVLMCVFVIQFTCTLQADAQYYTSRVNDILDQSFYPVKAYSGSIPELQQIISIDRQDTPIGVILDEIAGKADLGIAYNADLDFLENRVDAAYSLITVGSALESVLQTTDYEPAISKMKELIFVKRKPLKPAGIVTKIYQDLSGQVRDSESGEVLPGVNVFVKGTNIGTSTDSEGRYSLTVPDDAQILVFSFIGYRRLEVPIGDRTQINVQLEADVAALEDVVVVGYGTQQRKEVTGAVSSVGSEKLENVPVTSFENAIQGQIAGVTVSETTGEPGATPQIQVRGTGSISAGNDPLYVIDGLPISKNVELQGNLFRRRAAFTPPKANPLATLNPNDIESIEVLKDASAAAIYGSRGSNGVIMITTNKGHKGISKPAINFSAYGGVQNAMNVPDLMNSEELIQYTKDSRNNNYLQSYDPTNLASPDFNPVYDPDTNAGRPDDGNVLIPEKYINWDGTDTDWLDLVLSPAELSSYNLSVGGGYDNLTYYISGGYYTQNGVIDGSGFDRYTIKANVIGDLSEKFQVGLNVNAALAQHDRLPASAPYFARPPGIVYSALVHSPVVEPFNEDGTPNQLDNQSHLGGGTTTASNPLAILQAVQEDIDNNRLFGNAYVEYDVLDNLTFKTQLGTDIDNYQRAFFRGNSLLYRNATEGESYAQSSSAFSFNWLWENTLNYQETFDDDHRVNALVGYTAQKQKDERNSIIAQNFSDDRVRTVNAGVVTGGEAIEEEWSLVSALARLNYSYKEKYLLTATIRADRSSRFGADNQTGVFPSVSVGWRLTNEPFMGNSDLFNELKLRASYGETGNFLIPNYGAIGLLGQSNYILGDQIANGLSPVTIGNDELSWETTRSFDVGMDYALLSDRIYGSVDYYFSRTKDLLLNVTVPSSTGFDIALTNIGEVENQGFEFSVTSRNTVNEFLWATDFNFSTNRNEVVKLGPEGDPILSSGAAGLRHITQIGAETGSYYGYVVEGIYQNQAEIDDAPEDLQAPDPRPGDFRFKDVNGDGMITPEDRTITGSYHPDFTYGITNRFNWKGLDLSIFVQGVEGREILNLTARHLKNGEANFNSYAVLNDRWISPEKPGNGEHPRADRESNQHGNNNRPSSYQVEDGSYIRIKNVTFGYRLPVDWIGKFAKRARVYATATNLAIFTDYIGFNPEVNLQASSSLTPGEDYGAYPLARTITLGIDLSF